MRVRVRVRVLTVRDEKKSKRRRRVMGLSFFVCIIMRLVLASLLGYSTWIFIGKS